MLQLPGRSITIAVCIAFVGVITNKFFISMFVCQRGILKSGAAPMNNDQGKVFVH